jgi:hypothetical protein
MQVHMSSPICVHFMRTVQRTRNMHADEGSGLEIWRVDENMSSNQLTSGGNSMAYTRICDMVTTLAPLNR